MANLCRINNNYTQQQQRQQLKYGGSGFLKSGSLTTKFTLVIIIFCFYFLITKTEASRCQAKCSPHFTLPCSFGAFDKCIENTCKEACLKDGNRKMIACYCRGTVEGPTMRACFCSPSPKHKAMVLF